MSSACDPTQQIGTYADPTNLINTKNIDLVSLTATTVNTTNFTVDGVNVVSEATTAIASTQNESATAGNTSFSGVVYADGLTSPTSFNFASALLVNSSISLDGVTTVNGSIQFSNTSTSTLGTFLYQTTAATPSSYTANVFWYIGKSATANNMLICNFRNAGLGSASNYLSMYPFGNNGLDILPTQCRINTICQINAVTMPPKTLSTIQTVTSATTYTFSLTTISGMKRIVIMGIDVVKPANTPYIQVGQGTNFYTNNVGCYVGNTKGNNGSAQINFGSGGMYLWNSSAASPTTAIDWVIELQYLHNDPGYQVWSVQGSTCNQSGTLYQNWVSGTVNMNAGPYPNLTAVRVIFPAAPSSGYINVLAS